VSACRLVFALTFKSRVILLNAACTVKVEGTHHRLLELADGAPKTLRKFLSVRFLALVVPTGLLFGTSRCGVDSRDIGIQMRQKQAALCRPIHVTKHEVLLQPDVNIRLSQYRNIQAGCILSTMRFVTSRLIPQDPRLISFIFVT
jgi:hypothetical protein